MRFAYELIVEETEGGWIAALDDVSSPLRGFGDTPLSAIRMLCLTIEEWPKTGSRAWLASPEGKALRRLFEVPSESNS